MSDPLDTLLAALSRLDDDGNRVFPVDEVRHAIPLVVLLSGLELATLSEGVQRLMVETMLDAGVDLDLDTAEGDDIAAALAAWYHERPVAPALLEEIRKAFEGGADAPSRAARALLGSERPKGVLGGGERPPGTVPGPLGRLASVTQRTKK
ncbi:MAG: hypothetical protein IT383_12670 [Deltaproteobacteria bacterium]|nr:hypothetical protein [Deltaproteobacteria bacterium]